MDRTARVLLTLTLLLPVLVAAPALAQPGAPAWVPAAEATVHPGVQTLTAGGQCTSNFVFYDDAGAVYMGQAAHCASQGSNSDTNGCTTPSEPLGTEVEVTGAEAPATLVYSSWLAMQEAGETQPDACAANDFALVRLADVDRDKVNPSLPFYGGPTGIATNEEVADTVYTYGNSGLRPGDGDPKQGSHGGLQDGGWTHVVRTTSNPGVPGDSGSGFIAEDGRAFGVLSTLGISLLGGVSNGVSDLRLQLVYMAAQGGPDVTLALGTLVFNDGEEAVEENLGDPTPPSPGGDEVERLSGETRIETAVAVSQDRYPEGGAGAVVLARSDVAADALAGTPLAAARNAPLLLTQSSSLHPAARTEIDRLLGPGGRVFLLGGDNALSPQIAQGLMLSGYMVTRLSGPSRVETALEIARAVTSSPAQILLADAFSFADALVAGPAAHAVGGAVVLTDGAAPHPAVDAYLAEHPEVGRVSIGTTAGQAYPAADNIAGATDEATSVAVAGAYTSTAAIVGIARVDDFADALAGGTHIATAGGALLLTPSTQLDGGVEGYLRSQADHLGSAVLYGGSQAVSQKVADAVATAIS